jgi:large subunit ribosomal protein L29
MKAARWRDLSEDEVTQKVRELSEEVFNLRFQLAMGVAKNPSRIGQARRDLARAYTIIRQRGGAPEAVAASVAPATAAPAPTRKRRAAASTRNPGTKRAGKKKAKG